MQISIKTLIKTEVRKEAFKEFKNMQANHEKGKDLQHENLSAPQSYMTTNMLNNKRGSSQSATFHSRATG